MATGTQSVRSDVWSGNVHGDEVWIGRHSADGDTLVFDPALSDPTTGNVSFFSLTQFRQRVFSRAVASERIHRVTDEVQYARAEDDYRHWPERKAERERQRATEREATAQRQRQGAIDRHRAYLEQRSLPFQGVRDTSEGRSPAGSRRRRTKCHSCGIALDDFAASECVVCNGVLCSCGACACGAPVREK